MTTNLLLKFSDDLANNGIDGRFELRVDAKTFFKMVCMFGERLYPLSNYDVSKPLNVFTVLRHGGELRIVNADAEFAANSAHGLR